MTDVYGANLYNRFLAQQHAATAAKLIAQGTGSQVTMAAPEDELVSSAAQCHSILVCGVYVLSMNVHVVLASGPQSPH